MTQNEKFRYIAEHKHFENARTLYDPVAKAAELFPENTALRFMGRNIRYATLAARVTTYKNALRAIGLTDGEAVTTALPNIPESVYLLYAAADAGLRISPLHPLSSTEAVRTAMQKTGSRIVFVLGNAASAVAEACPFATVVAVSPAASLRLGKIVYSLRSPLPKATGNLCRLRDFLHGKITLMPQTVPCPAQANTAVLLQSGGTTGTPKIIGLSADAVNRLARRGLGVLGREHVTDCGMLSVLPIFHGFGLAMGVHAMLCHGGKNVLFPKFHRASAVKEILRGNVQFVIGVPRLYEALLSHPKFRGKPLRSLVVAFVGGDFVPHTLLHAFDRRVAEAGGTCRLFEGYGLTETVTVCSVNTEISHQDNTVGRPLDEIDIAAFDFSGAAPVRLPTGEKGELGVASDTLMEEYLSDPAATEAVFFTHNGMRYVRTGDCGYLDARGFVHFLSRLKRIIKVRGIPVYPLEIEQLVSSIEGVTGVCAVAVANGGEEALVLFVESAEKTQGEKIGAYIREKLSEFAVPKDIVVLPHLPLTDVSKIDAKKLLEIYTSQNR